MPRGFDPTQNDITIKFIQYVHNVLQRNKLNNKQIITTVQNVINTTCIKQIQIFQSNHKKMPNLKIQHCFYSTYFPAFYNLQNHQITVCKNLLKGTDELKQNFIRQFTISSEMCKDGIKKISSDQEYVNYLGKGCFQSYGNAQLAKICCKYILRHRGINEKKMCIDNYLRYINILVEQCPTYNIN